MTASLVLFKQMMDERNTYRDAQRAADFLITELMERVDKYEPDFFDTHPDVDISLRDYNNAVRKILEARHDSLSGEDK